MTIAENPFKIKSHISARSIKVLGWSPAVGKKWNSIISLAEYLFANSDPGKDARIVRKLNQALNKETAPNEDLDKPNEYHTFVGLEEEFHSVLWYHGGISSDLVNEIVRIGRAGLDGNPEPSYSVADAIILIFRHKRWGQGHRDWMKILIEFLSPKSPEPKHRHSSAASVKSGLSRSATATTRSSRKSSKSSNPQSSRTSTIQSSQTSTTRGSRTRSSRTSPSSSTNSKHSKASRDKPKSSASSSSKVPSPDREDEDVVTSLRFAFQALSDFFLRPGVFSKVVKAGWFGSNHVSVIPKGKELFRAIGDVSKQEVWDPLIETGGTFRQLLLVFAFRPARRNNFSALINTCKHRDKITKWLEEECQEMGWPANNEFQSMLEFHYGKEPVFDAFHELRFIMDRPPRPRRKVKGID